METDSGSIHLSHLEQEGEHRPTRRHGAFGSGRGPGGLRAEPTKLSHSGLMDLGPDCTSDASRPSLDRVRDRLNSFCDCPTTLPIRLRTKPTKSMLLITYYPVKPSAPSRRGPGRPSLSPESVDPMVGLARENPLVGLRGYLRIAGELKKLGSTAAQTGTSVRRVSRRRGTSGARCLVGLKSGAARRHARDARTRLV